MITSSIPMDETRLTRYIDVAIQDFIRIVGIYPGVVVVHEKHGFFAHLWKLGQDPRYAIPYRPRTYEWINAYVRYGMQDNEIILFLYYHPTYLWGIKYKIENERVFRITELKDGYRMPRWTVHETLEKVRLYQY